MAESYIKGRHPSPDGGQWTAAQVTALGTTVAALHATSERSLHKNEILDPQATLLDHHASVTGRTVALCQGRPAANYISLLNDAVVAELEILAKEFEPSSTQAIDHRDLVVGNILFKRGSPYFIDWTRAMPIDPALGLALAYDATSLTESTRVRFSSRQQDILMQAYRRTAPVDESFVQRFRIWRAALSASLLVKTAGVLLAPDAPHFWKPLNTERAIDELTASLIAKGYPLP